MEHWICSASPENRVKSIDNYAHRFQFSKWRKCFNDQKCPSKECLERVWGPTLEILSVNVLVKLLLLSEDVD